MAWHACHVHCNFSLFFVFTHRLFHKCLVTKESVDNHISRVYPFHFYYYLKHIIIFMTRITIRATILKSMRKRMRLAHKSLLIESLWSHLCTIKFTKIYCGQYMYPYVAREECWERVLANFSRFTSRYSMFLHGALFCAANYFEFLIKCYFVLSLNTENFKNLNKRIVI